MHVSIFKSKLELTNRLICLLFKRMGRNCKAWQWRCVYYTRFFNCS
jgi:hypothetical protein